MILHVPVYERITHMNVLNCKHDSVQQFGLLLSYLLTVLYRSLSGALLCDICDQALFAWGLYSKHAYALFYILKRFKNFSFFLFAIISYNRGDFFSRYALSAATLYMYYQLRRRPGAMFSRGPQS